MFKTTSITYRAYDAFTKHRERNQRFKEQANETMWIIFEAYKIA